MRTETRAQIIKLVEENGKIRPIELRKALQLSAVAIHRQLRALIDQGILEVKGSTPFTQYVLAGVPDLEAVSNWLNAKTLTKSPESMVCETRDIFAGRLSHLKSFIK